MFLSAPPRLARIKKDYFAARAMLCGLACILFFTLLNLAVSAISTSVAFAKNGKVVLARIIQDDLDSKETQQHRVRYVFELSGKKYERQVILSRSDHEEFCIRGEMPVTYDQTYPERQSAGRLDWADANSLIFKWTSGLVILLSVMSLTLVLSNRKAHKQKQILESWPEVEAKIRSVAPRGSRYKDWAIVEVAYYVNGHQYPGTFEVPGGNPISFDDVIEILYNPRDPSEAVRKESIKWAETYNDAQRRAIHYGS